MITITHLCGHTQDVRIDELAEKGEAKGILQRMGTTKEVFVRKQVAFLERNLCPPCYRAAKEKNPFMKPN